MPCGITQSETMKSNLFRPKSTQRVSSLPCIRSVMYLIQLEPEAAGSLLSPSLRLSLSGAFLQMINPPDGAKQWKEGTGGWSRYWPNHFWGLSSQALAVGIQYCKQISGVCVWDIDWVGGSGVHRPLLGVGLHGSVEALRQGACQRLPWTAPFQGHCSLTVHASSLMNSLIDLLPWPLHMQGESSFFRNLCNCVAGLSLSLKKTAVGSWRMGFQMCSPSSFC